MLFSVKMVVIIFFFSFDRCHLDIDWPLCLTKRKCNEDSAPDLVLGNLNLVGIFISPTSHFSQSSETGWNITGQLVSSVDPDVSAQLHCLAPLSSPSSALVHRVLEDCCSYCCSCWSAAHQMVSFHQCLLAIALDYSLLNNIIHWYTLNIWITCFIFLVHLFYWSLFILRSLKMFLADQVTWLVGAVLFFIFVLRWRSVKPLLL